MTIPIAAPPVIVTVGKVNADDTSAKYVADDKILFDDYVATNRYENDNHIYMVGITSPSGFNGSSVAFIQLAAPTLLWVSDWTTQSAGTFKIPNPVLKNKDWILLNKSIETGMIVTGTEGSVPIYRISGTYTYGLKNPDSDNISKMNFTKPPWLEDTFDRTILAASLDSSIIIKE